ncbi:MAG: carbohydrate kinase family protein [Patescibacteria group bacterium]|nr:carbohydrate kinase family protein [Patescibacteria group bacterium]
MFKAKYDIITIGGVTRDFFVLTEKGVILSKKNIVAKKFLSFELGSKIYAQSLRSSLGGGACNTAVGFSKLGLKTSIKICVNEKEEGDWIKQKLKEKKVDISQVVNTNKEASGFSFIIIDSGIKSKEHIIFSCRGANKYLKINPKEKFNTKWFYLSSFSGDNWQSQLKNINQIIKNQNIKLAFNPGRRQINEGISKLKFILKNTQVLILNREEAIELILLKHYYSQAPHIKLLLKELYVYSPNLIIITDGTNGVYAYDGKKFYKQKSLKVKVIDTTGAGDAFSSGFIFGFIKYKGDIKKALKLGVKNGASVVKKIGAQEELLDIF